MPDAAPTLLDEAALRALVQATPAKPCQCALGSCPAWESVANERWPAGQMRQLGTLRDPDVYEPSFEEQHPQGTRYDSVNAPVAVKFFPYNRSDVFACTQCQRRLLRYTEFGGYYVDHRVRELRLELVVG